MSEQQEDPKPIPQWLRERVVDHGIEVDLESLEFSDEQFTEVIRLRRITSLKLANTRIRNGWLEKLARLPGLRKLDLSGASFDSIESLGALAESKSLKWLIMRKSPVLESALVHLGKLKQLETLDLQDNPLSPSSNLKALQKFSGWLYVGGCNHSEEVLAQIANSGIRKVSLFGTEVSEKGVELLSQSRTLDTLCLRSPTITDESIEKLTVSKTLTNLWLGSENITNKGVLKLRRMKQLTFVNLYGCEKVKPETIDKLRQSLPAASYVGNFGYS